MNQPALNEELAERIFANLREGLPFGPAAAEEGVVPRTARSWREKGEKPDAPEPYRSFAAGVEFASAQGQAKLFRELLRWVSEGKNPSTLLDTMGRMYPKEFGKKNELDIQGGGITVIVERPPRDKPRDEPQSDPDEPSAPAQSA